MMFWLRSAAWNAVSSAIFCDLEATAKGEFSDSVCFLAKSLSFANLMVFDHLHIKVSDARLRPAWAALGSKARRAEVAAWCAPELLIATSGEGYDRPMLGGASSERRRASDTLHPVSAKCDVYSFAMTAYEVILREKPFAGTSDVRWLAVESRDRPPVPLPLERDEAAGRSSR